MTSHTRINLNSVHLIPTVAVWQLWKILIVCIMAAGAGVLGIYFFKFVDFSSKYSLVTNERSRVRNSFQESCYASWIASGKPAYKASTYCSAAATAYANKEFSD